MELSGTMYEKPLVPTPNVGIAWYYKYHQSDPRPTCAKMWHNETVLVQTTEMYQYTRGIYMVHQNLEVATTK